MIVQYQRVQLSRLQDITEGHLCTAQAVLKQVGINGVAWTYVSAIFFFLHYHAYAFSKISGTYFPPVFCPGYFLTCRFQAIAVHTFSILVLRWNPPVYASKAMVIGVWALTAAIVGISYAVHRHQHYYGASGGCKSQSSFLRNR